MVCDDENHAIFTYSIWLFLRLSTVWLYYIMGIAIVQYKMLVNVNSNAFLLSNTEQYVQ